MLQVTNVSKSFHQRGIVLNELDLTVNEGDSVSVSGPSGSGKTTLLNIIGLLDRPDSGIITFRGEPVLEYDQEASALYRNRHIGFSNRHRYFVDAYEPDPLARVSWWWCSCS